MIEFSDILFGLHFLSNYFSMQRKREITYISFKELQMPQGLKSIDRVRCLVLTYKSKDHNHTTFYLIYLHIQIL